MKYVSNLNGSRPLAEHVAEVPEVGDRIQYFDGKPNPIGRLFLAAMIGDDSNNPGSVLWFAWNDATGTLCTVSVGYWWKLHVTLGES